MCPVDRMPVHIGNFISRHVYSGRLSTQHSIKDKACCSFIDVHQGSEESKGGTFQVRLLLADVPDTA